MQLLQKCSVDVNSQGKELRYFGTPMFPITTFYNDLKDYIGDEVIWHWHEEIEFFLVICGEAYAGLGSSNYILKSGEGIFVNANSLHTFKINKGDSCIFKSIIFHPNIISGAPESVFEQKFVLPLLSCSQFEGVKLSPEIKWQYKIIQNIRSICESDYKKDDGYEWQIRELLLNAWYEIFQNMKSNIDSHDVRQSLSKTRAKKMLSFIEANYENPIGLKNIADSANISERECSRCFKKVIGTSPIIYLMKYRVSVASRLLLDTDMTITEICYVVGFKSPSYFIKIFKQYIQSSPQSYRKNMKNNINFSL